MKLNKYIESLQKVLKKHGNVDVVYSIDDEGNGFEKVHFDPTVGFFNDGDFVDTQNVKEYPDDYEHLVGKAPNCVCVN